MSEPKKAGQTTVKVAATSSASQRSLQRQTSSAPRRQQQAGQRKVVRFRTEFNNTILDVLKSREGWEDAKLSGDPDDWDFYWADKGWVREQLPKCSLREHQRINHFPNFYELTRKDNLAKNLKRMRRQIERELGSDEAAKWGFFPMTYNLPADYHIFMEEFKKHVGAYWIMKPIGKSQGKGIFLFNRASQISQWKFAGSGVEQYVVQRYIRSPYLVGGKKFDCRVYALCASYSPLVIYLHRSGFARFTHSRYSTDESAMKDSYVHLTNVAVQKHSEHYDPECGCKWDMRALRLHMLRRHGKEATDTAFLDVQFAIIRSLLSVQRVMINDKRCFELYGFDILFDDQLKPWVLEVNASPSMTAETPRDYRLKTVVLNDTLDLADLEGLHDYPEQIFEYSGGFDLIYNDNWAKDFSCLGWFTPGLDGPPRPPKPLVQPDNGGSDDEE